MSSQETAMQAILRQVEELNRRDLERQRLAGEQERRIADLQRENQERARRDEQIQHERQEQARNFEQLQQQSQQQARDIARLRTENQQLRQQGPSGAQRASVAGSDQTNDQRAQQNDVIDVDALEEEQPGLPGESSRNRRRARVIEDDTDVEVLSPQRHRRPRRPPQPAIGEPREIYNVDFPNRNDAAAPNSRSASHRPHVRGVPERRAERALLYVDDPEQSIPSEQELYDKCANDLPNNLPGYREFRTVYTENGVLSDDGVRMMTSIRTFFVDTFVCFKAGVTDRGLKAASLARMDVFARERVGKSVHVVMIAFLAIKLGIFPIITIGPNKKIPVADWVARLTDREAGYGFENVSSTIGGAKKWSENMTCLVASYSVGDIKNIWKELYTRCRLVDGEDNYLVPVVLLCDEADETVRGTGRQDNIYANGNDMTQFEQKFHAFIRRGIDGLMFVSATLQGTMCTKAEYGDTFDKACNLMTVPTPVNYVGVERYEIRPGCELVNGQFRGTKDVNGQKQAKLTNAFFEQGSPLNNLIQQYIHRLHPYHSSREKNFEQGHKLKLQPTDHQPALAVHPSMLICITSKVNDGENGIKALCYRLLNEIAPNDTAVVAWVGKPVIYFKDRDGSVGDEIPVTKKEDVSSVWQALGKKRILPDYLFIMSWTTASKGATFTHKALSPKGDWMSMPLYAMHYVNTSKKGDFSAIQQRVLRSANDCMTWTFTDEMKVWTAMDKSMLGEIIQSTKDFEDHYHRLAITRDTHETAKENLDTDRVYSRVSKRNITLREAGAGTASRSAMQGRSERQEELFFNKRLARQLVKFYNRADTATLAVPQILQPYTVGGVIDKSYYQNALQSLRNLSLPDRAEREDDAEREAYAREQWKLRYEQTAGSRGWEHRAIRYIANSPFYKSHKKLEFRLVVEYVQDLYAGPQDASAKAVHRVLEDNQMSRATASNPHRVQAFEELDLHGDVRLAAWVEDFLQLQ